MAIAIARSRGWQLAMRDRNAVAVAAALGVTILDVEEFLSFLDGPKQIRLFDEEIQD